MTISIADAIHQRYAFDTSLGPCYREAAASAASFLTEETSMDPMETAALIDTVQAMAASTQPVGRTDAWRADDVRPNAIPRHGAYICLTVPADARRAAADAPVEPLADRL